jgi:hypothetical protein
VRLMVEPSYYNLITLRHSLRVKQHMWFLLTIPLFEVRAASKMKSHHNSRQSYLPACPIAPRHFIDSRFTVHVNPAWKYQGSSWYDGNIPIPDSSDMYVRCWKDPISVCTFVHHASLTKISEDSPYTRICRDFVVAILPSKIRDELEKSNIWSSEDEDFTNCMVSELDMSQILAITAWSSCECLQPLLS